jgi:hypothetical protein
MQQCALATLRVTQTRRICSLYSQLGVRETATKLLSELAPSLPVAIEKVFVKSKSHTLPSLSKSTRFVSIRAEGFKWFEVSPTGGQGDARGSIAWAQVQGAARVGEWKGLFGVEIVHPGVERDVTVLWCSSESERDEVVVAINHLTQDPEDARFQAAYDEVLKSSGRPFSFTQLCLVGEGRAGKTSLANSLCGRAFVQTDSTIGVGLEQMQVTHVDLQVAAAGRWSVLQNLDDHACKYAEDQLAWAMVHALGPQARLDADDPLASFSGPQLDAEFAFIGSCVCG